MIIRSRSKLLEKNLEYHTFILVTIKVLVEYADLVKNVFSELETLYRPVEKADGVQTLQEKNSLLFFKNSKKLLYFFIRTSNF